RSLGEATDLARTQGIMVVVTASQPTEDQPMDVVIGQSPGPGSWLRRGDTVKLTVSAGLRPPNVVGKSLDEARSMLVRQGWTTAPEIEQRVANGAALDSVIEQRPGPEQAMDQKG